MKIHILEREYDLKNNIIKILYNSDGTRKYKIGPYPNTISLTGNEKNVSELFEWIRGIYKPGHLSENQFKDCYNIEEMTEDILILNMVDPILLVLELMNLPKCIINFAYDNTSFNPDTIKSILMLLPDDTMVGIYGRDNTRIYEKKVIIMQKYAYLLERTIQKYVYNPMSNSFSIEISGYAR